MSSWFWFAFPWRLKMSSIFSCAYWPFVYLLWRNVYLDSSPISKLGYLSFYYWVVIYMCVCIYIYFRYKSLIIYIEYDLQIFSPILLSFHFLDIALWSSNILNFEAQFTFLLLLVLLVSYLRIHCQIQGHEDLPLCFLLIVLHFYVKKCKTFSFRSLVHFELIFVRGVR